MTDFTFWDILHNLLLSTRVTLVLFVVALLGGALLGLFVLLLRISSFRLAQLASKWFIELVQGIPLLLLLFLVFFGFAAFGLNVPAWLAASAGLIIWTAAFLAEIWRGCVQAIVKGQWEASACLGMGYIEQMRYVILPQAFRISIPPSVGFSVQVLKGTALTSIIGFVELTKTGTAVANATYQPFTVFALVGLIYFILCWPISKGSQALERRLNARHRTE